jgi:Ran GTPase-activating protein (RanGAP) involved in mRNA processing and transport
MKLLADSLKYDDSLTFLNLSKNGITEVGAQYLGMVLEKNQALRVLFLHWNKLQAKGGMHLAKAL